VEPAGPERAIVERVLMLVTDYRLRATCRGLYTISTHPMRLVGRSHRWRARATIGLEAHRARTETSESTPSERERRIVEELGPLVRGQESGFSVSPSGAKQAREAQAEAIH